MRILIVEDEPKAGDYLRKGLTESGFVVDLARDGVDGLAHARGQEYDLIVLDVMLPGMDGWQVLQELRRERDTPVLFLTARDELSDRLKGLELGADDYMVKPFDLRELEARLRALMRRPAGQAASLTMYGNLGMDLAGRTVEVNGALVDLGRREFRLLEILLGRLGHTVPKERIMAQLFSLDDGVSNNALELLVSRLRKKLAEASIEITTIRGVGYLARQHAPE